ncbi:MAG: CRTAC1 family protein [Microcoleaceae cyanobacterium]
MNKQFVHLTKLFLVTFLLVLAIVVAWRLWAPMIKTASYFSQEKTPLTATYDLFDLGIVDANNDDFLDIFTLNHSARQNLILSAGFNKFTDVLSEWNLDQDRRFPQLEDTDTLPKIDAPGLYIYRQNFDLHLRAHQLKNSGSKSSDSIKGSLRLSLPVQIKKHHRSDARVQQNLSSGKAQTTVDFSIQTGGWLVLQGFPEILHSFNLDQGIPLNQVYVGIQKLNPTAHRFDLMWRDRHSMAWADFNRDGYKDIFVGRGAVRGQMAQLSERFSDELFVRQSLTEFQDRAEPLGIEKNGCPGRQSTWVDFNNDDRLDLYLVCGRSKDPTPYPSQLYQQRVDGTFVNIAPEVGLDLPQAGHTLWLDTDRDGDMDLISSQEEVLQRYVNQAGKFKADFSENLGKTITKFAVADFDQDGDQDLYVVTTGQNVLLVNSEGQYLKQNPVSIGLPEDGVTASWVDYDNDGLLDLHVVPHGLYRQTANHRFRATQILDMKFPKFKTRDARCAWFDADNNGTRDLLIAFQQTPSVLQQTPSLQERLLNQLLKQDTSRIWQSRFYRNLESDHHWLELKLVGSSGNSQAIGAKVELLTADGTQVQYVGSSEDSYYSQGHYRLYFGLRKQQKPDLLTVTWPDGQVQKIKSPTADQLLTIEKNS